MIPTTSLRPLCERLRSLYRTLCRRLSNRLSRRRVPAPLDGPPIEVAMELIASPEERPKGCGWFDSSYELGQGLLVREHDATTAAQALAAAPLADWLEFQLGGWRPSVPAQA